MLEIRNLSKRYKSKKITVDALKSINLTFPNRGFIVLTGKSGSGKSTLLNLLGGLDRLDQGEIIIKQKSTKQFKGQDWDAYRNTYVGFIFQEFYLIDEFTIGKNIALALELQGYEDHLIDDKVLDILKQVDLDGVENRKPNELSGGQKQRIALARALIKDPQIILCDEPTGNLDSETGRMILLTLKKLSKTKLVIMVTHDIDFAQEFGDRIIELKDGIIINDYYPQTHMKKEIIHEGNDLFKNIIEMPQKRKLTDNVIDYINNQMLKKDKDLYIVISESDFVEKIVDINEENDNEELLNYLNVDLDDEFILKKTALSYKNTFKLALSSILSKKLRLIFMSLLFIFALTFVGVTLTLTFHDSSVSTIKTFEKAKTNTIPFTKSVYECPEDRDDCGYYDKSVTSQDLKELKTKYPSILFYKTVYRNIELADFATIVIPEVRNSYYNNHFTKLGILSNTKLPLLVGNNPTNRKDVLITDYMAEMFIYYKVFDLANIEDLISQTFTYNDQIFTISGIVETDYKKYDDLKLTNNLNEVFYNSGFSNDYHEVYSQLFMSEATYNEYFLRDISYLNFTDVNTPRYNQTRVTKGSKIDSTNLIGDLPIKDNELVVTASYLKDTLGETIELSKVLGKEYTFKYHYLSTLDSNGSSCYTKTKKYELVGIIQDNDEVMNYDVAVIDSEYEYLDLNSISGLLFKKVTAILGEDKRENHTFIESLEDNHYRHHTIFSRQLSELKVITSTLKIILAITGGIFSLFAAILIYSFISSSINRKQKDIGTLRALGAKGIDIGKIFMTEGLIIALFSSLIASIFTIFTLYMLNNYASNQFNLKIVIFYINPLAILLVFILAIIIVLISSVIPIRRISQMMPINAIKKT